MRDKLFSMVRKKSFLFLVERITCFKKKGLLILSSRKAFVSVARSVVALPSRSLSPLPRGTSCQPFTGKPISEAAP